MPDSKEPSVFDAVNSALEELTPGSSKPADEPTIEPAVEIEELDTDLEGEPEGETEDKPATEADAEIDPATGKPKEAVVEPKLDAEGKPIVEAPKLDAQGKPIVEAKKPDPINDPIPKDLGAETQTRMRSLIKTAKDATGKVEAAENNLNYLVEGVKSTGASPQQYGEVLSWMQLFNSGDPVQQAKALELVETVADKLSALLGKERATSDPLGGFDDLKAAVAQGQITKVWATQIATQHRQSNTRTEIETSARTQHDTQAAATLELDTARNDLNALEAKLSASDPQFKSLKAGLVNELREDFKKIPPREWLPRFQQAYRVAKAASPQASTPRSTVNGQFVKGSVPANQPLRAKTPSGGGTRQPANMGEAINAALASLTK